MASTATLELLSCFTHSSTIESAMLSHNLSGCPSVTLSDVKNNLSTILSPLNKV